MMANLSDVASDERTARMVLSMLVEPNDPVTGRILSRLRALETLWLAEHDREVVGLSPVDAQVWRERLRVPDARELAGRIDQVHQSGVRALIPGDNDWPTAFDDLGEVAPYVLWTRGTSSFLSRPMSDLVTITGARACTSYGEYVARELASSVAAEERGVFCGQCGSRLLVCNAKSSQGTIYPYFVCASRHGGRGDCTRQAMLIEQVERLIERFYAKVQLDPETTQAVSAMIHARFDEMMAEGAAELADLASRRTQLEGEQQKLLQAHYAGAIPLDLLKKEQDRITASLETIEHRITAHHGHYADARANLDDSLKLLSNAADLYEHADDANRRLCNQALFRAIYIDEDNDVRVGYRNPYDGLSLSGLHADALSWAAEAKKMGQARTATKGGPLIASSHLTRLGWLTGLEPATTGTTSRCSTN